MGSCHVCAPSWDRIDRCAYEFLLLFILRGQPASVSSGRLEVAYALMRGSRLLLVLLVALGLAVALLTLSRLRAPTPTITERPPAPVPETPKPPLQADAEGYYVPGYNFTVDRFRFVRLTLRPEAFVTIAQTATGTDQEMGCDEAIIKADAVHLRCDYSRVGTITIDGRFLTRLATTHLDAPVLSAVVTVRTPSGEILYRARDSFVWHPAE